MSEVGNNKGAYQEENMEGGVQSNRGDGFNLGHSFAFMPEDTALGFSLGVDQETYIEVAVEETRDSVAERISRVVEDRLSLIEASKDGVIFEDLTSVEGPPVGPPPPPLEPPVVSVGPPPAPMEPPRATNLDLVDDFDPSNVDVLKRFTYGDFNVADVNMLSVEDLQRLMDLVFGVFSSIVEVYRDFYKKRSKDMQFLGKELTKLKKIYEKKTGNQLEMPGLAPFESRCDYYGQLYNDLPSEVKAYRAQISDLISVKSSSKNSFKNAFDAYALLKSMQVRMNGLQSRMDRYGQLISEGLVWVSKVKRRLEFETK